MSLLNVDEVREHGIETDLGDDALQRVMDAAEADIIRAAGELTEGDTAEEARRIQVLVNLVKLAIQYEPVDSRSSGSVTERRLVYTEERERLLNTLLPDFFV